MECITNQQTDSKTQPEESKTSISKVHHPDRNHKFDVSVNCDRAYFPSFVLPLVDHTIIIIEDDDSCQCTICLTRKTQNINQIPAVSFRHINTNGSTIRWHLAHPDSYYYFSDHQIMIVTGGLTSSSTDQKSTQDKKQIMDKQNKIYTFTLWDLTENTMKDCYIAQQENSCYSELWYFLETKLMCFTEQIGVDDQWERTKFTYFKIERNPKFKMIPIKTYEVVNRKGAKHFSKIRINNRSGILIIKQIKKLQQQNTHIEKVQFVICDEFNAAYYTMDRQIYLNLFKGAWEYKPGHIFIDYQSHSFIWNYKKNKIIQLPQKLQKAHNVQFIGDLHNRFQILRDQPVNKVPLLFYPATFVHPQTLEILYQKQLVFENQNKLDEFVNVLHHDKFGYYEIYIKIQADRIKMNFIYIRIQARRKNAIGINLKKKNSNISCS